VKLVNDAGNAGQVAGLQSPGYRELQGITGNFAKKCHLQQNQEVSIPQIMEQGISLRCAEFAASGTTSHVDISQIARPSRQLQEGLCPS
jgi:hypothetical protein